MATFNLFDYLKQQAEEKKKKIQEVATQVQEPKPNSALYNLLSLAVPIQQKLEQAPIGKFVRGDIKGGAKQLIESNPTLRTLANPNATQEEIANAVLGFSPMGVTKVTPTLAKTAAVTAFETYGKNITKVTEKIKGLENKLSLSNVRSIEDSLAGSGTILVKKEREAVKELESLVKPYLPKESNLPEALNMTEGKNLLDKVGNFIKTRERMLAETPQTDLLSNLLNINKKVDRTELTGQALKVPSEVIEANRMGANLDVTPWTRVTQTNPRTQSEWLQSMQEPPLAGKTPELPKANRFGEAFDSHPSESKSTLQELINKGRETSPLVNTIQNSDISVKSKVSWVDYFRTPDRVLKKIGAKEPMDELRKAYEGYETELPKELEKIFKWSREVPRDSNQRIFKWLDGQSITLLANEQKVANEIKDYLANFADRLKLPKEKRITNYITHVFDRGELEKEFDPELAKIISEKVPGSVYDPFVLQRLGKFGYIEDTWQSLEAYVKRGTRKANLDPTLGKMDKLSDNLELSQYKYLQRYLSRVNMRPTEAEDLADNFIKSTFGYKLGQRPTTALTKTARQWIYRGTLGLNLGSAVKNLSQVVNTYSKLGEKYTLLGYSKFLKNAIAGSDELERVGVLKDNFVQDRTLSATKKFWEYTDKGLFFFFDLAERVNRGASYYGAKSKALAKGATEQEAIESAKKLVRDTQFAFSSIDTPVALSSDLAKTLLQFQTYGTKQTEFLGEMVKNKEWAGMARYIGSSLLFIQTIGSALGMRPTDFIPQIKIGSSPLFDLLGDVKDTALNLPDKYGKEQDLGDRVKTFAKDVVPFVPAGVQVKKSGSAIMNLLQGGSYTPSGRLRYNAPEDPLGTLKSILFGPNATSEAQEYYKKFK